MAKLADASDLRSDGVNRAGSTPATPTKQEILVLYPEFTDVYGPYLRKDGRRVIILYDGDKRSARQLAKVILEVHLGRRLTENETVDHVDNDKSNDSIANLQILSREANAGKDRKSGSYSRLCSLRQSIRVIRRTAKHQKCGEKEILFARVCPQRTTLN